jgi:hypothetical protein
MKVHPELTQRLMAIKSWLGEMHPEMKAGDLHRDAYSRMRAADLQSTRKLLKALCPQEYETLECQPPAFEETLDQYWSDNDE